MATLIAQKKAYSEADIERYADKAVQTMELISDQHNIDSAVMCVVCAVTKDSHLKDGYMPLYNAIREKASKKWKASKKNRPEKTKTVSAPPSPARRREMSSCGYASAAMERNEEEAYKRFNPEPLTTTDRTSPPSTIQTTQHIEEQLQLF